MSTYRDIITKRDTRAYADAPIPDDVLRRILQAGRMAGSAKDSQPLRLVVLRNPDGKSELAECGAYTQPLKDCVAAVVLVLLPEENQPRGEYALHRGPFDAGRTGQNIMIAAWAEGVTSCPVSIHKKDDAARVLGLPDGHTVANVIALAYPKKKSGAGRPRLPLEEFVHWERWQGK